MTIRRIRTLGTPGGEPLILPDDREEHDRRRAEALKQRGSAVLPPYSGPDEEAPEG